MFFVKDRNASDNEGFWCLHYYFSIDSWSINVNGTGDKKMELIIAVSIIIG